MAMDEANTNITKMSELNLLQQSPNENMDTPNSNHTDHNDTNTTVVQRILKLSEISMDMIHDETTTSTSSSNDKKRSMVCLQGWIYSVRVQGAGGTLIFLDLNDGSLVTPLRCLAEYHASSTSNSTNTNTNTNTNTSNTEEEKEATMSSTPSIYLYNNPPDTPTSSSSGTKYAYLDESHTSQPVVIPIDTSEYQLLTFEQMSSSTYCCIGGSCMVVGYVTKPPATTTATQLYEIKIHALYLIGRVPDASKYPIQKSILKKPTALRNHPHARFRAPIIQQFMQIRSTTLYTVHEFFFNDKVPLLDPNIMTNNDCEGAGEVFTVMNSDTFFHTTATAAASSSATTKSGKNAPPTIQIITSSSSPSTTSKEENDTVAATATEEKVDTATAIITATTTTTESTETAVATTSSNNYIGLTVSSQLPLEAMAMGTGSVYTCQKSFRAEKSDTNKHLAEFLHIEYESYFITLYDLMNQAERFVKYVLRNVLERCSEQYAFLNHRTTGPEEFHGHDAYLKSLLDKPFVRITHADAVTVLLDDARQKVMTYNPVTKQNVKLKFKIKPAHGEDLGSEHEKYLVQKYGTFVFVTHWPSDIKSFYMKQVGDGTCESFDLLAPIVGELFGGSMREWRYEVLESMMQKKQMDTSTLQWFIDLRKDGGTAPHGGWGMGFDRLVMLLTNTQSVRDIVPYPVYYGHCPY